MRQKTISNKIILSLFFAIFYLPIIKIIFESFIINNELNLNAYYELFKDSEVIYGFINSIIVAIITVLITIKISLLTIKYFFLNGIQKIFLFFNIFNLLIPEIVFGVSLLLFFSFLNITLGFHTLIISHIVFIISYTIPLIYQKWIEINPLYLIAAQDLGANKNYIWKTIIIKLLEPTIISASFLAFILSFDDYIFSYFCANVDTLTLVSPLLSLLRNGISPKIKALFFCILLFSLIICISYIIYIGIKNEKKQIN